MLFDLRSRGRRRTVRIVYSGLAVLMVLGLVGLGIGTGSSGGLLNAGENNSSGGGSTIADQALKKAVTAVNKHPTAANWANLMQARWSAAGSGSNYNSSTGYTAGGQKQLKLGTEAWQSYLKLADQKSGGFVQNAFLAGEIYQYLGQYANEAHVWNLVAETPSGQQSEKPLLCWAYSAYAGKQTATGNLAAAKALALVHNKVARLSQKSQLKSASTSASTAVSQLGSTGC